MTAKLSEQVTGQRLHKAAGTSIPPNGKSEKWFDFNQSIPGAQRLLLGAVGWLAFLALWQITSQMDLAPDRLYPGPVAVFSSLQELFLEKNFFSDVLASVTRIVVSFGIAVMIALPFGLLMGSFARVDSVLNPLLGAWRYLPAPAFIPLLLMWLGTGDSQKITLLLMGVVFFLVIMLADVTRQTPRVLIETAKTLGGGRRIILWTVLFRNSLPGYLDTCRQMLAVSWTYLVIAEIVAATDGIGAMMMRAKRFVHVDDIMAGIVTIGALGLMFDVLFRLIYRKCFPYLGHAK
ncbi:NitT/TauT family transport system permease protein [Marinobacter sp. DSM 26671]|jgi:NitT/TauT family transport system permease protein|uniref:ABC transporter permease n=1 Tax=Marinobacter sp. DSM 26671 TaxID=1761793 RepID=UPI0008F13EC2|nr:ABC transporter permease [Marinobacter sp. DSM 26671]SFD96398.1 NitT/TauT family transport system permease protein [Marinobacter sp. DSM 26671]